MLELTDCIGGGPWSYMYVMPCYTKCYVLYVKFCYKLGMAWQFCYKLGMVWQFCDKKWARFGSFTTNWAWCGSFATNWARLGSFAKNWACCGSFATNWAMCGSFADFRVQNMEADLKMMIVPVHLDQTQRSKHPGAHQSWYCKFVRIVV